MTITKHTRTAEAARTAALAATKAKYDSIERSDTDGALTQLAHGLDAEFQHIVAEVAANNGKANFQALFDLEGNLVAAKKVQVENGFGHEPKYAWMLLESDDVNSACIGWVNLSNSLVEKTEIINNAVKGYYVGKVSVDAWVEYSGSGKGLANISNMYARPYRIDEGFSRDAVIVDNGIENLSKYAEQIQAKVVRKNAK